MMRRGRRSIVVDVSKIVGGAGTVAGCAIAVLSLWSPWAVDGPQPGTSPDRSGWQWMAFGDVLLILACVGVLGFAGVLCFRPASWQATVGAGAVALILLAAALAGVVIVRALTDTVSFAMDSDPISDYERGPGMAQAIWGLVAAMAGVVVLGAGAAVGVRRAGRAGP